MRGETKTIAEKIIEDNDGKIYYSIQGVAKIIGCGRNRVPLMLNDHGILVRKMGAKKMVTAYDIAELMASGRVSPLA